eukprot:382194-Hanusia_phi.AAC.1
MALRRAMIGPLMTPDRMLRLRRAGAPGTRRSESAGTPSRSTRYRDGTAGGGPGARPPGGVVRDSEPSVVSGLPPPVRGRTRTRDPAGI